MSTFFRPMGTTTMSEAPGLAAAYPPDLTLSGASAACPDSGTYISMNVETVQADKKVGATAISLARRVPMIAAAPGPAERLADNARDPRQNWGREQVALRPDVDVAERLGTRNHEFRQFVALVPPNGDVEGFAPTVDEDVGPFDWGELWGSDDPEGAFVQGSLLSVTR